VGTCDKFVHALKKQRKVLVIEYRNFALNDKGKSHLVYASSSKMKETLDYRIRFKQGFYALMEKTPDLEVK